MKYRSFSTDEFTGDVRRIVRDNGWQLVNYHAHLDRAFTRNERYLLGQKNFLSAHQLSLQEKQSLTGKLHEGPAYKTPDLIRRITKAVNEMHRYDCGRCDTLIDTTDDVVGLRALEASLAVKESVKDYFDLRVAAYGIFGFKDDKPKRWQILREGAERADFIGSLPERDALPGHIGITEHLRRHLQLAGELGKSIHIHVDQKNVPDERLTLEVIEAVKWMGSPTIETEFNGEPSVWAIHVISPSCYSEERFQLVLDGLKRYNIGVICCPSAALSMAQYRNRVAPIHNSIARIREMIEAGIVVRMGTDNIHDMFLPSTPANMYYQIQRTTDDVRTYNEEVLARIACGQPMSDTERDIVRAGLLEDQLRFERLDEEIARMEASMY